MPALDVYVNRKQKYLVQKLALFFSLLYVMTSQYMILNSDTIEFCNIKRVYIFLQNQTVSMIPVILVFKYLC